MRRVRALLVSLWARGWWAPAFVLLGTLALECALVERKYAIVGGGFGASHVLDTATEWALFVPALVVPQALLVTGLWLLIRACHGRRPPQRLVLLDILFFTLVVGAGLLALKYEVLSYFSDAIGFQLIRSLGGGSLGEALRFVRDEVSMLLAVLVGGALAYAAALMLARRFVPAEPALPPVRLRHALWLMLATVPLVFAADRDPDARYALTRFNAFALAEKALAEASDFDRDGYGWFGARIDTHPLDPARHPLALDIPDNGIDEDGLGGDFRFDEPPPQASRPVLPAKPRNLVLIVLESTRGDAIGRRVGGREVTPALNALARNGSYAREAYSHVGFTSPSLKSLFSGKLDPAPGDPSLFRDLKRAGYRIAVYSGQAERFGDIAATVGMEQTADIFVDANMLKDERAFEFASDSSIRIDGRLLLREFDRSFSAPSGWDRPAFVYFNLQEAHFPYHHPGMEQRLPGAPVPRGEINAANKNRVALTYWNAVASADWIIGQIIARLQRLGVWDDTLLVVTADHGESLFDDDFLGHGHVINRQQTEVPLILSKPGVAIAAPIGLDDYRAMILGALGAAGVPARRAGPVFQYIGTLEAPTEIGMVERGGRWTTLRLDTETVWFSDGGRRVRYDRLAPGSDEKARVDRLTREWARQRWLAHIGGR